MPALKSPLFQKSGTIDSSVKVGDPIDTDGQLSESRPKDEIVNRHCGYALLLTVALACSNSQCADGIRWLPDLESAKRASHQFKVPLLIHFYGENCARCKLLETTVYSRPELIETLNKYFVCVRIDGSQQHQLAAEYQVHSWPTDVFLGPESETLQQGTCPMDFNSYMKSLEIVALRNRDRNIQIAAHEKGLPLPAAQSVASNNIATPSQQRGVYTNHKPFQAESQAASLAARTTSESTLPATGKATLAAYKQPETPAASLGTPSAGSGLAPSEPVMRGPLNPADQPQPTRQATPAPNHPIGLPATPVSNASVPGQLPARNTVGQVANEGSMVAGRSSSPAAHAGMPTVESPEVIDQPMHSATFAPTSVNIQVNEAQFVDNPYYPSPTQPQVAKQVENAGTPSAAVDSTATPNKPTTTPNVGTLTQAQLTPTTTQASPNSQPKLTQASFAVPTAATSDQEPQAVATTTGTDAAPHTATNQFAPALEGYCPVALQQGGNWVEGKRELAVKHRGKIYWLSSPEAREQFLGNPDGSSPLLSGYDPWVLLEKGELVQGSIEHGLLEQVSGQYLFFATAEAKQKYWDDFDRYSKALNGLLRAANRR